MTQYIDKIVIITEIDNRIKKYILLQQKPEMSDLQKELQDKIDCLNSIKSYILNTLEVKEIDIDALSVLAEHLIACDAHLVTPKYTDRELDILEGLVNNKT